MAGHLGVGAPRASASAWRAWRESRRGAKEAVAQVRLYLQQHDCCNDGEWGTDARRARGLGCERAADPSPLSARTPAGAARRGPGQRADTEARHAAKRQLKRVRAVHSLSICFIFCSRRFFSIFSWCRITSVYCAGSYLMRAAE